MCMNEHFRVVTPITVDKLTVKSTYFGNNCPPKISQRLKNNTAIKLCNIIPSAPKRSVEESKKNWKRVTPCDDADDVGRLQKISFRRPNFRSVAVAVWQCTFNLVNKPSWAGGLSLRRPKFTKVISPGTKFMAGAKEFWRRRSQSRSHKMLSFPTHHHRPAGGVLRRGCWICYMLLFWIFRSLLSHGAHLALGRAGSTGGALQLDMMFSVA